MPNDRRHSIRIPWHPSVVRLVLLIEGGAYLLAVVVAVVAEQLTSLPELAALVFAFAATLAATTPFRRRLFAPIRESPAETVSIRGVIGHVRERRANWWQHETALAVVGGVTWLVLAGVATAVLTGWQYRRYAGGATSAMHPANTMALLLLCAVIAAVVAGAVGSVSERRNGPTAVVAAVRAAPRAFTRHALVGTVRALVAGIVGVIGAHTIWEVIDRARMTVSYEPPSTVGEYWTLVEPVTLVLWIALPVIVATVGRLLSVAGAEPSTERSPAASITVHSVRVVAVVLLLVGASIVGTAAVRIDDTGYSDAEVEPLPEAPSGALQTAQSNTFDRSYRRVTVDIQPDGEFRGVRAADRADRQYRLQQSGSNGPVVTFGGEGVAAVNRRQTYELTGLLDWGGGNWSVTASKSGAYMVTRSGPNHPHPDASWRVVRENETALVLGVDGAEVGDAVPNLIVDEQHFEIGENTSLRVVVDRERRVLESTTIDATYYRVENGNRTDRRNRTVVRRYENVGTHDVQRPDALGPRRPIEWVWDFLYY